ncbi:MAG: peptidyl-prolyl cis-trans isomerase [Salinibacter sp.]
MSRLGILLIVPLLGLVGAGCQSETPPPSYVARVGSHYLTQEELDRRTAGMDPLPDTAAARRQIIDQWVTRMLLYREAERLNLASTEAVQKKLKRHRRSVLVTALKNRLYEKVDLSPSPQEVRTYFERHKEKLRLREPYVQVRYLSTSRRSAAQTVRQTLQTLPPEADSTWHRLVRTHAADTVQAYRLSRRYMPESRLVEALPFSSEAVNNLQEGSVTRVVANQGEYHVFRLDRRRQAGTIPKLRWIEPEIRRRLRIRARKQMYAHEVQRLRRKAKANNALDLP